MEDWWLVRGAQGQTGWVYSHLLDVTVPDTLARYAEGQRVVGSYLLTTVQDPESGILNNGQTVTAVPEYVAVLNSWQAGLPYDFDQVRVFIWNLKKHRYETSFRERNIMGYLPVKLFKSKDPYGKIARRRAAATHLQLHRPRGRRPSTRPQTPKPARSSPQSSSPRPTASKATSAAASFHPTRRLPPKPTPLLNPKKKRRLRASASRTENEALPRRPISRSSLSLTNTAITYLADKVKIVASLAIIISEWHDT